MSNPFRCRSRREEAQIFFAHLPCEKQVSLVTSAATILIMAVFCVFSSRAADLSARENEYYKMITIPVPDGLVTEAGALQWMPDGQLAISTRRGEIYFLDNVLSDPPANVKFHLFASGLHEVLGLAYYNGDLYATQRGEVTRLRDTNHDGKADVFETVSDFWSIIGDYHEYAFGSKVDPQGNLWVALCLTGSFTSDDPFRGWCLRVNVHDGTTLPTCSGLRSPGGIGTNSLGDMFYTDNQGPWNGACALKHLRPGGFMGNPSGNLWYKLTDAIGLRPADPVSGSRMNIEADRIPELIPPAVLFPYNKMGQSASGVIFDRTAGKFGPFADQLFVPDQTHSTVMRVTLEQVRGRYQGACYPFRQGFGSGCLSEEYAPDGSLFVYGTDRGWGSRGGKPFALQRLIWTGKVPFEIHEMQARPDGFNLTFTEAVDPATAENLESYTLETFTYIYQASYGSPEVDRTHPTLKKAVVSADKRSVRLILDGLQQGHVHELHVPGVKSATGEPLLHPEAYYTLNYIPKS
jgi:glucose/arabinose dehydrogenase